MRDAGVTLHVRQEADRPIRHATCLDAATSIVAGRACRRSAGRDGGPCPRSRSPSGALCVERTLRAVNARRRQRVRDSIRRAMAGPGRAGGRDATDTM